MEWVILFSACHQIYKKEMLQQLLLLLLLLWLMLPGTIQLSADLQTRASCNVLGWLISAVGHWVKAFVICIRGRFQFDMCDLPVLVLVASDIAGATNWCSCLFNKQQFYSVPFHQSSQSACLKGSLFQRNGGHHMVWGEVWWREVDLHVGADVQRCRGSFQGGIWNPSQTLACWSGRRLQFLIYKSNISKELLNFCIQEGLICFPVCTLFVLKRSNAGEQNECPELRNSVARCPCREESPLCSRSVGIWVKMVEWCIFNLSFEWWIWIVFMDNKGF